MAGRALAFSDPDIIRMATRDYVPVAGDDWYQRRRQDEEGRFFRKVADQGPRKGAGGSTRQGIYCLTADGKLLTYKNAGQAPDVMRDVLRQGLVEWRKLPEERRKAGAVRVGDTSGVDDRYDRKPPPGVLIVNVFTRTLERNEQGELTLAAGRRGREVGAARDHLWLTEMEWKSLVPANPRKGDTLAVPAAIAERIARFHLVDDTRGEPPHWQPSEIRSIKMDLRVEEVSPAGVGLRLEGAALLASEADPEKARRGYDVQFVGTISYNARKKAIDRFDVVALGDHWGHGPYTRGARPGRSPLGVAFEVAKGNAPADLVPPQGARVLSEYFGRRR